MSDSTPNDQRKLCVLRQIWLRSKTGRSPKSTQPSAMCSNHNTSNKGRSPNRKIIQRNVQQPWLRAMAGRSPERELIQRNVQLPWLRAMAGRSPKGNTAQGNTLGTSLLTNWRAVSATGTSEMLVRSFLLLFQSASLLESLYPGRCPGLYSYWAFSPSLQQANHLFKVKQQNFKANKAAEIIFLIVATE